MEERSSEELMLRCRAGDAGAFDALMRLHERGLVRFFEEKLILPGGPPHRRHRDWARARDLAQETFLRAFNARARYVPSAKFTTWLYHIALNLYRDEMRRLSQRPTLSISREYSYEDSEGNIESYELHEAIPDESIPSAQEALERTEQHEQLLQAMRSLSPKHREVLRFRYFQGLEYAEIAERLDCSIGTVKSRLHYAACALRRHAKAEMG